jgi:hypothetical protein
MARRTHQSKGLLPSERQIDGADRRSGGKAGVFYNAWVIRSISVKIERLPKSLQVLWQVHAKNLLFGGESRFCPDPIGVFVQKVGFRAD